MKQKLFYTITAILIMNCATSQEVEKEINALFPQPKSEVVKSLNFFFDTRYDYTNTIQSHHQKTNDFSVNTTRFYITSNILNKFDFNFRYNLHTPTDQKNLEFAFLEYHFNKQWSFSAGELITAWGTFEIDYNGADLYMYSNFTKDIEAYNPGINLSYAFDKQKINLQIITPEQEFVAKNYKNKALGYLFLWEGNLFNNVLQTRYGFALIQHNSSKYYNWTTLGNKLNIQHLQLEIDWMYGFRDKNLTPITDTPQDQFTMSYVNDNIVTFNAKYNYHNVTPFIKLMRNKHKDLTNQKSYSLLGVQTAIEYYPLKNYSLFENIKLFASYNHLYHKYEKDDDYSPNFHENKLIIGFRWLIPVFKAI